MKVFLAGTQGNKGGLIKDKIGLYLLESFIYLNDKTVQLYKDHNFLLDSGAFTYMNNKKGHKVDWDEYITNYASFIDKHDIEHFFELDIDSIVGLKEVERLRYKLEKLTNKQCIPVWHKSRGKDYWLRMVKDYSYVAIGGIVTKEIMPREYRFFPWFLSEARKQDCKVHGLGFTNMKGLRKYPFYSVDSTSWLSGQKFAKIQTFNGRDFDNYQPSTEEGSKLRGVNPKKRLEHNFNEWVKFQKYAEKYL